MAKNKTIIFYTVDDLYLNGHFFLIRVLEIIGKTHEVNQFLVRSDLDTESLWLQPA